MSTFLVVLWVIGVIVVMFGLVFALMAMNWATRDNTLETLFETLTMSASILFYTVNNSDFTRTIFDKVYGFIRICMGLNDTDLKFVPKMFDRGGELDLSLKLVIGIVLVAFFIRYIVSA